MATIKIVTGDDVDIPGEITFQNAPFPIAATATVTAALRNRDVALMTPVTLDDGDAGSDWATGVIRFKVPAAQSALLTPALQSAGVFVAVQIDDVTTGKSTVIMKQDIEILLGVIP